MGGMVVIVSATCAASDPEEKLHAGPDGMNRVMLSIPLELTPAADQEPSNH